jgi:hypothetical protein
MSLLNKAVASVNSRKPREVEELLALIAADESAVISVPEMMKLKQAFAAAGAKLPYFESPEALVSHVHTLLS